MKHGAMSPRGGASRGSPRPLDTKQEKLVCQDWGWGFGFGLGLSLTHSGKREMRNERWQRHRLLF